VKFSVLLPSRNGGAFIEDAISSVLDQSGDFELVVADNANTDQTSSILAARKCDPRLRVVRSEEVLPVTENWLRALHAASGDYFLMIGDDDLLLPGFFERAALALERNGHPDCLTFDGYSYVAPGSFGRDAPALWSPRHFDTRTLQPERDLSREERLKIVRDMFRFKVRFPLNMQLTLFSRAAVAAVPGEVFRAPFPDHFALNSFLLRANRVVVTDERLLVVGVSPKSFGHFFYGGQQVLGLDYLGSHSTFERRIEGSELVNSMYAWLLELRRTYPEVANIAVDRWAYAARQVNHWLRQVEFGYMPVKVLVRRIGSLPRPERLTVLAPMVVYRLARRSRDRVLGQRRTYIGDSWQALRPTDAPTITAFARSLSRE
jgi:glycosyltransferase involved in cell wall biosynthesis